MSSTFITHKSQGDVKWYVFAHMSTFLYTIILIAERRDVINHQSINIENSKINYWRLLFISIVFSWMRTRFLSKIIIKPKKDPSMPIVLFGCIE